MRFLRRFLSLSRRSENNDVLADYHDSDLDGMDIDVYCSICGGYQWKSNIVLWQELIDAWDLSEYEAEYVNRQQGRVCTNCGSNLRSVVLAQAIMDYFSYVGTFEKFVSSHVAKSVRIIEINEAGTLHDWLRKIPGHRLLTYPETDMMNLPLKNESVDVVVHSDTLEHIQDPVKGLSECRRVLSKEGAICFTVPIIIGRLTRSRDGLVDSFHGDSSDILSDLKVTYEFGADVFDVVFKAGFSNCKLSAKEYPAAIAITAVR